MSLTLQKERLLWVDYSKLIGIYLVILGHLNLRSASANAFINSFHMQLFFFLAGVCFKKESFFIVLKKNCKGLLIPYVSFYIICYPYWFAKSYFQNHLLLSAKNYIVKPFLGFLYGVVYDTEYSFMVIGAVWFLLALFFIKLFASLIIQLPNVLQLYACVFLCFARNYFKTF